MTETTTAIAGAFRFMQPTPPRTPRRDPAPSLRRVTVDGQRALAVGLIGKLGTGWECLVDPETWEWVRGVAGERWHLEGPYAARAHVATNATAAARSLGRKGAVTSLARLIANHDEPLADNVVVPLNGSRLDLRRANLKITPRVLAEQFRATRPLPAVTEGWAE